MTTRIPGQLRAPRWQFQFQASGFLKALLWVVTVSGSRVGGGAARVIDVAEGDVGGRLERRVAAQEDRVADAQAGEEAAAAGAEHGLVVELRRRGRRAAGMLFYWMSE